MEKYGKPRIHLSQLEAKINRVKTQTFQYMVGECIPMKSCLDCPIELWSIMTDYLLTRDHADHV